MRSARTSMRSAVALLSALAAVAPAAAFVCGTSPRRSVLPGLRAGVTTKMGIFDAFKKAFSNEDYSQSPAIYAQTKASARHVLVPTKDEAMSIKEQIAAGADFADMARQFSTCNSKTQGGNLGSFSPKTMVPEFDEVIFDEANPLNEVLGPVQTKFGYHLIKIEARNIVSKAL